MIRNLLILPFLLFAAAASAQQAIQISEIVSFDYGSPLFINRAPGVLDPFGGTVTATSSASESYGIGAEFGISPFPIRAIGLIGRIEGVYTTGHFDDANFSISGIDRKLLLELSASYNAQPFLLRAGPWISQSLSTSISEIASGTNITPANPASNSTHLGFSAGIAWEIPNFPLQPEVNTHLDVSQFPVAGSNAWSVGLSLVYNFGTSEHHVDSVPTVPKPSPFIPHLFDKLTAGSSSFPSASVKFLVNDSEAQGSPPLVRVETRVKNYAMIDSANTAPRVTQWIDESYHLPHIALSCVFLRRTGANLMLFKDSLRLIEKTFPGNAGEVRNMDTVLDLDRDSAWQNILAHLNTGEENQLIAELRTNSETLRDTLVLPPADTTRANKTIVQHEFRFVLSEYYDRYKGGTESLNLLLARMKELLDSATTIQILEAAGEPNLTRHVSLENKLADVFGNRWNDMQRAASADVRKGFVVVMER